MQISTVGPLATFSLVSTVAWAQPDYAPAHWVPATNCSKYYTSGYTRSFCVIHDMEGYYLDSISYLNRCDTNPTNGNYNVSASIYYCVNGLQNGSDSLGHAENRPADAVPGDITQSVRESNWAWHARCWNKYMFGTEHEGFVTTPVWFTEAMYQASAGLHRHLCDTYGIVKDRNHIIGHNEWQNATWRTWMTNNYPAIDPTCNSHTDPGQYWNWTHFMALLNGTTNTGGPYWDMNGPNLGAGTTPTGIWDNTSTNWTADPNGGIYTGPRTGTNAIFAAGSDAGSYTVSVVNTQVINNLLVQHGTVTFTGGWLGFKGSGSYYSNYVAAGCTAIYNTPLVGTGSPDKWGPGTAVYNGASTSGGYFTLNEGTLALGNDAALGNTNRIDVGDVTGAKVVTLKSPDSTAHTLANYLSLKATNVNIGAGGNLTFTGPINMNTNPARLIAVSNGVTTFSGVLSNTAGLMKTGPGTLVLGGTSANTYGSSATTNGNTTVGAGTLTLSKSAGVAAVANGSLLVNPGGVLLLGAANQIAAAVPMTLAGGCFKTAGFSEGLGTLKLAANSVIDLGTGASVLAFAASGAVTWTNTATLSISNWSGSISGGGAEQLLFGANNSGLTAGQLAQVWFINPAGFPAGTYAAAMRSSGEVVPATLSPAITVQPSNRVAVVGNNISFTVSANATPPPAYQWRFNGADLSGATASALQLPSITLTQAGSYSAVITNLAGSATSGTALLSVYSSSAPTLSEPNISNGHFQLSLAGVPGYGYAVWASTNLSNWSALQTNTSPFIFTDTDTFPGRFYRAQYVP
jgi:hypothetical protein